MKQHYIRLTAVLLSIFIGNLSSASEGGIYNLDNHGVDMTIDVVRKPVFPTSLVIQGYSHGKVKIVLEVDYAGELRDWLVIESSHPDFTKSVDRVIDSWRFSPPHIAGESRSIVTSLTIDFESSGSVVSFDLASGLSTVRHNQMFGFGADEQSLATIDELDSIPQPIAQIKPSIPKDVIAKYDGARAEFTFFVDQSGHVRIPALRQVDGAPEPGMLLAAQDALEQWRFEPPMSKNRPVSVKMSQSFVFRDK